MGREEMLENNDDDSFETENSQNSQKTQNASIDLDDSIDFSNKLSTKKAITEILQQIVKSYTIEKIENYAKQLISPIVQIFSEQSIYTEDFINLMREIVN